MILKLKENKEMFLVAGWIHLMGDMYCCYHVTFCLLQWPAQFVTVLTGLWSGDIWYW